MCMLILHIKPLGILATDFESITEISLNGEIYNACLLNIDTRRVQSITQCATVSFASACGHVTQNMSQFQRPFTMTHDKRM
jgi:hypothetical protein